MNCNSEDVSFAKMKELAKADKNLQALLKMLGCRHFDEAIEKVTKVNSADKFLKQVKMMTK